MHSDSYDLRAYPLFRSVLGAKPQATKARRCLVIDPADVADAEVKAHADTLWKYVIQPALLDTDYEPRRAALANGVIAQEIVDALLDDDLVIAVLTFQNPHVFYETALAQAAARPLILMVEEGRELAFDARNAHVATYRLDTDSVVSGVNVAQLHAIVREIAEKGGPACHGFRPGTAALGGGCESSVTVYERSPRFSYDRRLEMMREAGTRIDIMGIANLALAMHPDTAEVVRAHSGGKLEIRILQSAPSNPGLVSLLGARRHDDLGVIQAEIDRATDAWRRIADGPGLDLQLTIRRAQASLPMASALITDRAVVATPYLRSKPTAESPTLHARAGDAYHAAMSEEFNLIWGEATTVFRAEQTSLGGQARQASASAAYWAQPAPAAVPAVAVVPVTVPAVAVTPVAVTPVAVPPVAVPAPTVAAASAPVAEPAPATATPANDAAAPEPAASEHASRGNDRIGSVHHQLFGSPDRSGAPAGEPRSNGAIHKRQPATVNERGHAIIRSVC